MKCNSLGNFYLVGGTALTLWLGHRKSVDIDLFYHVNFDSEDIAYELEHNFHASGIETGKNLVRCFISKIKVEVIAHRYKLIEDIKPVGLIRIAGLKDLAAMKLNAVTNRGTKKDFWDIASLFNIFSLNEMLEFYSQKYPNSNSWQVEKSLAYFKDADKEETEIISLNEKNWDLVKQTINTALKNLG